MWNLTARPHLIMDLKPEDREQVWFLLADLFFLVTEHPDALYTATAESLMRLFNSCPWRT
jgi:hypothetical protein